MARGHENINNNSCFIIIICWSYNIYILSRCEYEIADKIVIGSRVIMGVWWGKKCKALRYCRKRKKYDKTRAKTRNMKR